MVAWFVLALCLLLVGVNARVRYNSQLGTPYYNIRFADMTGDGIHEFLLFRNEKVYVTTSEYAANGLMYLRLPGAASRIIHGKFSYSPKEVMCAQERTLGRLDCYIANPANDALWWWWYQGDFIQDRQVIVGDYNSDGRDDILCYTPSTGTFQVYTWNPSTYFFEEMANWVPGNLGNNALINLQVRAGDFTGDGRTDLMFYNPNVGQVLVYIASYDPSISKYTMWWYFSSATGWGGSDWECLVANVNGDATEDAVLHNRVTGEFRTYNLVWDSRSQKPLILITDFGQIHRGASALAYFGKFKNAPATENSGKSNLRDDSMVFSTSMVMWIRADARWDGYQQTYWWSYTQYPINLILDQDGDGIQTGHELGGYDPNNDGISDGILPSYGASPFIKADYMAGPPLAQWNYALSATSISLAVSTMAAKGINLHIFTGNQVTYQQNLGTPLFDWVRDVDPIKNANFPAARVPFFHYCLMANTYNGSTSTGLARATPGQDFIVTLGGAGTTPWQVGTFLHELGHNLGLHHGSMDDTNYKPNHISIMNYAYQLTGIMKDNVRQFLYSDITCSNLNENSLSESSGVQCATGTSTYQTHIQSANVDIVVNTAFDWDRDGGIDASAVRVDVNSDGLSGVLNGGVNEFNALNYRGGSIGTAHAKRSVEDEHRTSEKPKSEPTFIYEPPIEELPKLSSEDSEDYSAYNLKPHHGPQFLNVPQRYPDIFKSAAEANVVTPIHHTDAAEPRNERHEHGKVNSEEMPSDFMAPVLEYSHAVDTENSAVNPALQQLIH